jgi:hypothetical protein
MFQRQFLTKDGKEVHAERDFVAEKQNGTIELTFTVTKGDLAGKTVVVFKTTVSPWMLDSEAFVPTSG